MLAVAEAEYLEVSDADRTTGRRNVACRCVQDAVVGPGESSFLDATSS